MRILIADDDSVSRRLLERTLQGWGYDVTVARDGAEAWAALSGATRPQLAVLDWMMPGLDGPELCRRTRAMEGQAAPVYVILLTARAERSDVVAGLEAGADDYVVKPFDRAELRARLHVGARVLQLQSSLAERVRELEDALSKVKLLQGLLPICSYCKRVRDDRNYWQQVESYVTDRSAARFSHSICPTCYEREVRPQIEDLASEAAGTPGEGGRER